MDLTHKLDALAVALEPARKAASEAQARANLAPWPMSWVLGLWARVLGVRLALLRDQARRLRGQLRTAMEDLADGHRANRSRLYREAQQRKDPDNGRL